MPEAVAAQLAGRPRAEIRAIQNAIYNAYVADMAKYADPITSARVVGVWRAVPEQLAKENHKFQYSTIASSARAHQYEAAISWLVSSGMVAPCYRASQPIHPLTAHVEHDFFKLYLVDVGLLTCAYGIEAADLLPDAERMSKVRGGLAENYVMQQLLAQGVRPSYWGTASREEVAFLFERGGQVIPIEVKSGVNVRARSLRRYREKYQPPCVIRVSEKNFGREERVISIPLYAVPWLARVDLVGSCGPSASQSAF